MKTLCRNKRSMDLGALLDNRSWYHKCQFSADLLISFQNVSEPDIDISSSLRSDVMMLLDCQYMVSY